VNSLRSASLYSTLAVAGVRRTLNKPARTRKKRLKNIVVANLQSLIVTVGREALSENAEWLITHRTRAARAGERVKRTISKELAFSNLIQSKRCRKLTLAKPNGSCR